MSRSTLGHREPLRVQHRGNVLWQCAVVSQRNQNATLVRSFPSEEKQTGASSMTLTLGDKEALQKVLLDSGASSMTVRVPRDSGVKLIYDGGLSSKNIADLDEVSEGVYQSPDYDDAKNAIEIKADVGLSSFTLERY